MPSRGSPGPSSCAGGRVETQSINLVTSRASKSTLSTSTVPVDWPKPRGSQVKTLYPACHSEAMVVAPTTPAPDALPAVVLVSPDCPHPGPMSTVGARCVADTPGAG